MRADEALIVASAELATSVPAVWSRFLQAFEKYSESRRHELVDAQYAALQVSQGKAKQCDELFKHFSGCVLTAEKIRLNQHKPQRP